MNSSRAKFFPDYIQRNADVADLLARLANATRAVSEGSAVNEGPGGASLALPTDPTQGWHLNAIKVKAVWTDYTGKGVTIGVVDDGFAYTHPDLKTNYDTSLDYDFRDKDSDALIGTGDGHGTKVAGVIGAAANGTGVVGVAYGATIAGYRIGYGSNGSWSMSVSALDYAGQHADVVNSSWGYSTAFADDFSKSYYASALTALKHGVTDGRGGLGAIYVFSAGNERASGQDVNYHNFGNSPYTIAVAATDSYGKYTSYSDPGAALLIAAPGSSIQTTTGTTTYGAVSGTSFSAPIVSSIVALMLEANPDLGYRDVQEILAMSAAQTDATSKGWATNGANNWNGGGMHFSHDYGFGLVDARAAVRLAETWNKQSTIVNQASFSQGKVANLAIPDGNATGVSDTIVVTKALDIQSVQVMINITHTKISDLTITLTSPDGTTAVLAHTAGGSSNTKQNLSFSFTANNFWGENPVGAWKITVTDSTGTNVGSLVDWTMTFNGDAAGSNPTYFYTDAYGAFTDAARQTLSDSSAGVTINAAQVTGNMVINLNANSDSTIAGKTLHIASDTNVKSFYAGDGNDIITGNSVGNILFGGRGNDTIDGAAGTDTAVFLGNISAFSVQIVSATTVVVTYIGPDGVNEGTDTLLNIENFKFGDQSYTLSELSVKFGAPVLEAPATVVNNAPTVATPVADQSANEDAAFSFTIPANAFADVDSGDALTYSAKLADGSALPSWLTFDAATRTFSGTPANGNVGAITVRVTATDKAGASVTDDFKITVNNVNDAPTVATPVADQTTNEDAAFSFTVPTTAFADVDAGDALTYSAKLADGSALPSWLTFNAATRTFSGTPANGNVGAITVRVTATDKAGASVTDDFKITVNNVNDAPTVATPVADQSANEDAAFSFTIPANAFADVDAGDALTYSAKLADGSALPGWLTFNAATRTFSGTPANGNVGAITVRVTATDKAGASVTDDFKITVNNVNDAPTVAIPVADSVATADSSFSLTIPANAFADVDAGDALTYSAKLADGSALPGWLTFDAATRTFSGTPVNGDVGVLSVRVTAIDKAGASVTDDFKITVNAINHAPTVATPVADQSANEDAAFTFTVPTVAFADVDSGDALTYSAKLADGSALPSWLTFDAATRTFSGTPANGNVGTINVRVTATDKAGASVTDDFKITVNNVNDAPTVATPVADQTTNQSTPFSFTVPTTAFADVDAGDALTYSAKLADGSALPSWLTFDAATRTFSGTPASADVGQISVSVTATDKAGATVSDIFNISINAVNHAPTVATPVADQSANEDAAFSFTVPTTAFADVDAGDALTYSAKLADGSALPSWLTFDAATRTFSGTPANGNVGSIDIRVTATDKAGASVTDDFKITVNNVNDAPTVATPVADQSANEDAAFSFTVPTTAFADVDAGDALTYSAKLADGSALPSWLTFNAATRTFSGTPANGNVGAITVRVTATDKAGASVTDDFKITVNNVNDAPTVATPVADQSVNEDAAFSFTIPANAFADVDAGDALTYSAKLADGSALPSWLTFNAATRTFSGTPANGNVGAIDIRVTATDKAGASVTDDFKITVNNVNDAPTVATPVVDQSVNEDAAFSFTIPANAFADVDAGDALTYSAKLADGSALPGWLTFDAATRTFSGTPANGDVGVLSVRVTATDKAGAHAYDDFIVTVNAVNAAPDVAGSTLTASQGALLSLANLFSISDSNGDQIQSVLLGTGHGETGHWTISGVTVTTDTVVTTDQLRDVAWVTGTTGSTDTVYIKAYDGKAWSGWSTSDVTSVGGVNVAPKVTGADTSVQLNDHIALKDLFSVTDANGDTMKSLFLYTSTSSTGHWEVDGKKIASSATITPDKFNSTVWVAGNGGTTEKIYLRAYDGQAWSTYGLARVATSGSATSSANQTVANDVADDATKSPAFIDMKPVAGWSFAGVVALNNYLAASHAADGAGAYDMNDSHTNVTGQDWTSWVESYNAMHHDGGLTLLGVADILHHDFHF